MQQDDFSLADTAATFLLSKTPLRPKIGLVLGSGLGAFADELSDAARIPYEQIPSFPRSTAIGHAGQMVIGKVDGIPLAAMQGRVPTAENTGLQLWLQAGRSARRFRKASMQHFSAPAMKPLLRFVISALSAQTSLECQLSLR